MGVYTNINRVYTNAGGREVEKFEQGYAYSTKYIDIYFEIEKGGYESGTEHATRSARNTDRQTTREQCRGFSSY